MQLMHVYGTITIVPYFCVLGKFLTLVDAANQRLQHAFRDGTNKNHKTQITIYIQFCNWFGVRELDPTVQTTVAYLEYLATHLSSAKSVGNYFSAVSLLHKCSDVKFNARNSWKVNLMLRAIKLTLLQPNPRPHITLEQLRELIVQAKSLGPIGVILRVVFTWGYFGFLRQSNLAPPAIKKFTPKQHTTRGCVKFADPGLVITLPWSKNNQEGGQPQVVPLPELVQDPVLCPVNAYKQLLKISPSFKRSQSLLSLPHVPVITIPNINSWFHLVINKLHWQRLGLTLHGLRKGGATAAIQAGASFPSVRLHGFWRSDAIWNYIMHAAPQHSEVAHKFKVFV